ncbi:hypothetical protein SAMN04488071_3306 [Kordiimonas lacus]|uniref:Uncharacterized protein n=1 Tax=Kordiimonas lacus TaxID=637679 RepID=A0A1G7E6H0_9PROT|nr:hypothetical protein SAMN04488071_3306 [Kordiimonas lacus]
MAGGFLCQNEECRQWLKPNFDFRENRHQAVTCSACGREYDQEAAALEVEKETSGRALRLGGAEHEIKADSQFGWAVIWIWGSFLGTLAVIIALALLVL